MKYGATLRQHSIPAWAHHNIDYDDIKHYIKENTTPGIGKTISIPGAVDVRGKELENSLFGILQQQHQRITLFVKSKAGEIERRLDHLQKQTNQLAAKPSVNGRIPAKRLERYGRLEAEILKAGEELRCLARFCGAQQTAFRKLLKKHKKWTGSTDLEFDFNRQVVGDASSFTRIELDPLLSEYEETLNMLRTTYQERIGAAPQKPAGRPASQSTFAQLQGVLDSESQVAFDSYFAALPLGREGQNAVYWVHPDNIVELQILLLQHSRSFAARRRSSAAVSPALSRHNSITSNMNRSNSLTNDPDTGVLIADDIKTFVAHQSSSTFEEREYVPGALLQEAALHARWTHEDDALVTARVTDKDFQQSTIKRKQVASIIESFSTLSTRKASIPKSSNNLEQLTAWLVQHNQVKPLAVMTSNRARFADVAADSNGFILATLDRGIGMKQATSLTNPLEDVFSTSANAEFPFAVLRVRQEGLLNNNLIRALDQSHLVERVRGFSLEYHAVWYCCQPENVVPPFWVPLMQKDIRKLPTTGIRRKVPVVDSTYGSQSTTPQLSTSNGSTGDRTGDMTAVEEGSPVHIKIPDQLQTPPLSAFRKKRKSAYQRAGDVLPKQRYWSEYDNPSDSEDGGAYILYIDPNEESSATKTWRNFRKFLTGKKQSDEEALLGHDGTAEVANTESTLTSSDEESLMPKRTSRRTYGTVEQSPSQAAQYETYTQQSDWVPHLTATCFVASVLLLCIGYILVATGRRKLASEVDAGIVLAVASSLSFAVAGVGVTFGRRSPTLTAAVIAVGTLVLDAAAASILLVWAFG